MLLKLSIDQYSRQYYRNFVILLFIKYLQKRLSEIIIVITEHERGEKRLENCAWREEKVINENTLDKPSSH